MVLAQTCPSSVPKMPLLGDMIEDGDSRVACRKRDGHQQTAQHSHCFSHTLCTSMSICHNYKLISFYIRLITHCAGMVCRLQPSPSCWLQTTRGGNTLLSHDQRHLTTHAVTNRGIIYDGISGLQNVIKCGGSVPFLQAQLLQAAGLFSFRCLVSQNSTSRTRYSRVRYAFIPCH